MLDSFWVGPTLKGAWLSARFQGKWKKERPHMAVHIGTPSHSSSRQKGEMLDM